LFLSCPVFAPLWGLVRSRVGISSANSFLLHDHFVQFTYSASGARSCRFFMQLLWLCCIRVIWHEPNNRIFKAKESTVLQLLEKVKVNSLWWMKAYNITFDINSHMWWSKPLDFYGNWQTDAWFFCRFFGF
jgi:hypothetical protein